MAVYITKAELRQFAASVSLTEQANLRKSLDSVSSSATTFLSHSSKDDDLVVGAIEVLKRHGAVVYVDKVDPAMPPYTTEETAALLKQRIQQTQRFVLLASANSKESRWVPWELGIADGEKGISRIAVFPAVDQQSEDWTSWEYMGLYRKIVWGKFKGKENNEWMVLDEKKNTATALATWLSS